MSLYPYFYDMDSPINHPMRNYFRPSYLKPWDGAFGWENMFRPLDHLSGALNRLTFNDMGKITADDEKFQVNVDVQHFAPEEIKVKVVDGQVVVEGKHEEKRDQHGYVSRQFVRKYSLPQGYLPDTVQSKLSSDGVLTVTAPKVLPMPSTGERIIPITHTGPIKKQINEAHVDSSAEPDQQISTESAADAK